MSTLTVLTSFKDSENSFVGIHHSTKESVSKPSPEKLQKMLDCIRVFRD